MKAVSGLAPLVFACAASSLQAQQASPRDLDQFTSSRPTPQQSVPPAPAGKIRVLPDGSVLVGEGVVKSSVDFTSNNSIRFSFTVAGGPKKGTVLTCTDLKKMPDLSGDAREAFEDQLHNDLLRSPQGMANLGSRIEPFSLKLTSKGDGPNILRTVIKEVVTQLDEGLILARLICGSGNQGALNIN